MFLSCQSSLKESNILCWRDKETIWRKITEEKSYAVTGLAISIYYLYRLGALENVHRILTANKKISYFLCFKKLTVGFNRFRGVEVKRGHFQLCSLTPWIKQARGLPWVIPVQIRIHLLRKKQPILILKGPRMENLPQWLQWLIPLTV